MLDPDNVHLQVHIHVHIRHDITHSTFGKATLNVLKLGFVWKVNQQIIDKL